VLRKADHDPKTPELFLSCGFPISACETKFLMTTTRRSNRRSRRDLRARVACDGRVLEAAGTDRGNPQERLAAYRDIARADERGYMFILDRQEGHDRLRGFNIFPREVEDVLSQHADVAMVAVVGIPDDKLGRGRHRYRRGARKAARPSADELIDLVKARKGSAHAPKHVKFVTELPMTGVGKVDKKVLKAGFWTGRERMVG